MGNALIDVLGSPQVINAAQNGGAINGDTVVSFLNSPAAASAAATNPYLAAGYGAFQLGQNLFHPDYEPANGGEVKRQLSNLWPADKVAEYLWWLKDYYPTVFNNGKIWEQDGANASRWNDQWIKAVEDKHYIPGSFAFGKNFEIIGGKIKGVAGQTGTSSAGLGYIGFGLLLLWAISKALR
jgi:hypothetical protein